MLTLLKGLPLAYNRDLQDDKRFVFPAVDACGGALLVACGIVSAARFNEKRIAADIDAGFLDATALAEYLVRRGVPFRTAHQVVGGLVLRAEKEGRTLAELPMDVYREATDHVAEDVYEHLGPDSVVEGYAPDGAAGPTQLREQLDYWKSRLDL